MRLSRFAAGAAAWFALAHAAFAASPPPVFNWTGFYVGGNVGYGWGKNNSDGNFTNPAAAPPGFAFSDSLNLAGAFGGAQVGYNWQPMMNWVMGLETDWQSGTRTSSDTFPGQPYGIFPVTAGTITASNDAKIDWFGTVRGRVGYSWNRMLLYATGGLAYGRIETSVSTNDAGVFIIFPFNGTATASDSKTRIGWTLGGGIEGAIAGNWSWKAEYLYVDLGSLDVALTDLPFAGETTTLHSRFSEHIVRAGLNYKFGAPLR